MSKEGTDSTAVDVGAETPPTAVQKHRGTVVLVPQPSDDPNDPLVSNVSQKRPLRIIMTSS